MVKPQFDVVVFGASSFVGQILCRYMGATFSGKNPLRWAIAGRSKEKLEAVRVQLGDAAKKLPLILADASDEAALRAMCERTKVVVSTVGPYALYGEPLVKLCAETGTDYCDLTGEPQWIRRMIDRYEEQAKASGARIVPCCGFDSIPSDLGVWFLQNAARERFGAPCVEVKMRVKALRGGLSGGTAASMLNIIKEATENADLRRELANPYSLCPSSKERRPRQRDVRFAQYDRDFSAWIAPFMMAAINTRVVLRSQFLLPKVYGSELRYNEASLMGRGIRGRMRASAFAAGMAGFVLASAVPPSRWFLERFVLPSPGGGPSEKAQESGFWDIRFHGKTADGRSLAAKVTGDRDPGYGSTAKMLGQAAACLALDGKSKRGGFWTPATAMGDDLIDRLKAHSGVTFELLEEV